MNPERSTRQLLSDIVEQLGIIKTFKPDSIESYAKDFKTKYAVERGYLIVGEIVKRLPRMFREEYSALEWTSLAAFRDFIAHNYVKIENVAVWKALLRLEGLKAEIEEIIANDKRLDRFDEPQGNLPDDD
jgi:uncharacterized protein with HEPN domain